MQLWFVILRNIVMCNECQIRAFLIRHICSRRVNDFDLLRIRIWNEISCVDSVAVSVFSKNPAILSRIQ